jgi:hypothetical protein
MAVTVAVVPCSRWKVSNAPRSDVGQPVAVGQTELLVAHQRQHALQPSAGHGLLAGVDERHPPGLGRRLMHLHGPGGQVQGHVAGVQVVVGEVLLDHVAAVAQAHDEVGEPVGGVDLHDVPQQRLASDLDRRLGTHGGLLGDTGPQSSGEDDHLHGETSSRPKRSS